MSECCEDLKIIEEVLSASEVFEVRGKGDILVEKFSQGAKRIFEVSLVPYTPPQINATPNPFFEVGSTYSFTWSVYIQQGRQPIQDRSITPVISPAPDLLAPFTVSIANKKNSSRQVVTYFTITVIDSVNHIALQKLSVRVVNKIYVGFSYKDSITPGQTLTLSDIANFTATLADTIKSVYSGLKTYTIPSAGVLQYIYWIYEVGTTPINSFSSNGLPFPVVFLPGTLSLTNPYDSSITSSYVVVRSYNKFGSGPISLEMF